jgi:hypothetical protein
MLAPRWNSETGAIQFLLQRPPSRSVTRLEREVRDRVRAAGTYQIIADHERFARSRSDSITIRNDEEVIDQTVVSRAGRSNHSHGALARERHTAAPVAALPSLDRTVRPCATGRMEMVSPASDRLQSAATPFNWWKAPVERAPAWLRARSSESATTRLPG